MSCLGVTGELIGSKQFEWKIANFFSLSSETGSFYTSPSFLFDKASFHLMLYPGGITDSVSGFLSVYLRNETDCSFRAKFTLSIKRADGTLVECASCSNLFLKSFHGYGNSEFYDKSDLEENKSELVPSDTLTIICLWNLNQDGKQAIVQAEKIENLEEKQTDQISDYQRLAELDVLSENLKEFSANKESCDVVIEVEDKKFKVHKAILMARSSVFAAMFQHDTLEKQTGFIKISDCDSESFQEFLDYLYSGKLEDVSFRSAFHLYSTSNKYDVQKLKEFCIKYLMEGLSVDNVCDIVKLADKYDEAKLITRTQEFFNENWNRIFPTAEWRSFMASNLHLADKLLVEFSKTKDSQ